MTDYKEEQNNEIEALKSIYPEELEIYQIVRDAKNLAQIVTVTETEPYHQFRLPVKAEFKEWGMDEEKVSCILNFTYTPKYPDEAPVVEVTEPSDNLEDRHLTELEELIKEQIEENMGTVMVFTLVSVIQEKVTDFAESISKYKKEEKERLVREEEEKERKRFEGTTVTIETFLAWKARFDAELAEKSKAMGIEKKVSNKPTGKELFLRDHTLDTSDVAFLEDDTDAAVAVDESLFQDLDDLELEDELDLES